MDQSRIHELVKGPLSEYLKTPVSIWKKRVRGMLGGTVALLFIVLWLWQIGLGSWEIYKGIRSYLTKREVNIYLDTEEAIKARVKERTKAIQERDCNKSPTFELQFLNGTREYKDNWIASCKEYSKSQRDYRIILYKFENLESSKAHVRYFEIREMSQNQKVIQQYFEGKLYFEKQNDTWIIVNVTRNPLKQSEQSYSDL